jgi:hypothetical protein
MTASSRFAFCRQIDGLSVRGDMICADPGMEFAEVLNKTERDIFQLLSENERLHVQLGTHIAIRALPTHPSWRVLTGAVIV